MEATAKRLSQVAEALQQRIEELEQSLQQLRYQLKETVDQLRDLPLDDVAWQPGLIHDIKGDNRWKGHGCIINNDSEKFYDFAPGEKVEQMVNRGSASYNWVFPM